MSKIRSTLRPTVKPATEKQPVDKRQSVKAACEEMGVSSALLENWITQALREIQGGGSSGSSISVHLQRFQALENRLYALETEKDILLSDARERLKSN